MKKMNKKVMMILALAVLVLGGVVAFFLLRDPALELTDYVTVEEVTGPNGYGDLSYRFDYEELMKDLDIGDERSYMRVSYELEENLSVEVENNGALSNGDSAQIKVELNSDYDFGKKLKNGTLKHEVSGLQVLEKLDLFEGAPEPVFSGRNGNGYMEFPNHKCRGYMVDYSIPRNSGLSNGDTVVVTAQLDTWEAEMLMEEGYMAEPQTKEYTVSGLLNYATAEDMTDAMIDGAVSVAKQRIMEETDKDSTKSLVGEIKITGVFFGLASGSEATLENHLVVSCAWTVCNKNGAYEYETAHAGNFGFMNYILDEDGNPVCSETSPEYFSMYGDESTAEAIQEKLEIYYRGLDYIVLRK